MWYLGKSSEDSVLRTECSTVPNVTDEWRKNAWEFTTKFNQEEIFSDLSKSNSGNDEGKRQNRTGLRKTGRAIVVPVTLLSPTAHPNLAPSPHSPFPHRYSSAHNPGNPTYGRGTRHLKAPVTPEEQAVMMRALTTSLAKVMEGGKCQFSNIARSTQVR